MRKVATVTITDANRDKGKVFVITEMAARPAEKWATRVILALQRGGFPVPEEMAGLGFIGIASTLSGRMIGGLVPDEIEPLLDQMMACVQFMPNPQNPSIVRALVDQGMEGDDIEEIKTRVQLKLEVFALHAGFTSRGELMTWISAQAGPLVSQNTQTSPD